MAKYSADFKLKVVQYAAQNCLGARALSKIYGVNISSLRYWIKHYQCHGEQAFVKKRRVHSAEFKYQAVMHMRKNQMSLRETVNTLTSVDLPLKMGGLPKDVYSISLYRKDVELLQVMMANGTLFLVRNGKSNKPLPKAKLWIMMWTRMVLL